MTTPIWIEAAINGPWGKERQPGIPISIPDIVADGIAAVQAGAAREPEPLLQRRSKPGASATIGSSMRGRSRASAPRSMPSSIRRSRSSVPPMPAT